MSSPAAHSRAASAEAGSATFHRYSRLPPELRRQIWQRFLEHVTPRIYRFELCYQEERRREPPNFRHHPRPNATIIFRPRAYYAHHREKGNNLTAFVKHTEYARIAGATCTESRQFLLELLPDAIPFRHLPHNWSQSKETANNHPNLAAYPEHILRINSARDIIVFHAPVDDQRSVVDILQKQGNVPEVFLKLRHVGLSLQSLQFKNGFAKSYGIDYRCEATHDADKCRDHCFEEPLPPLLACFPSLKTFYIAGITDYIDRRVFLASGSKLASNVGMIPCVCPDDGGGGPKHWWPTVVVVDTNEQCVVYNERSGCKYPNLPLVEVVRHNWRSHFPYYKALEHLEVLFIQPTNDQVS
jgi:hypothetical protein